MRAHLGYVSWSLFFLKIVWFSVLLNEKDLNFSSITWENGETLADNLTLGFKQFQNHRLISQGCKSEYVWTQVDPSFPESVLFNSLLKVSFEKLSRVWFKCFCLQMYSHFWYDAPASQLATYYLKHDLPVYLYSFDHISENFYDIDSEFWLSLDFRYIFNLYFFRSFSRRWQTSHF